MTDDLQLLSQLADEVDETLAAIAAEATRDLPPPDHPMWARAARHRHTPNPSQDNCILRAPQAAQAPPECRCMPADVPTLQQQPRLDLVAGVVRCQRCGCQVPKSTRTKEVRWLRGLAKLHHQRPDHIDVQQLQSMGRIFEK